MLSCSFRSNDTKVRLWWRDCTGGWLVVCWKWVTVFGSAVVELPLLRLESITVVVFCDEDGSLLTVDAIMSNAGDDSNPSGGRYFPLVGLRERRWRMACR
jgi:hypothetical protein